MIARLTLIAACSAGVFGVSSCEEWLHARADREWQQWRLESDPAEVSSVANPE